MREYNLRMHQLNRFHKIDGPIAPPFYWKWTKKGREKYSQWWRVWCRVRDRAANALECVKICGPAS